MYMEGVPARGGSPGSILSMILYLYIAPLKFWGTDIREEFVVREPERENGEVERIYPGRGGCTQGSLRLSSVT